MRIEKAKVEIIEQQPGIEGMLRFIELCGRTAYKSEDRITEDSYQRFTKMLYSKGHWAVFNLGTVYMRVNPSSDLDTWKKLKDTKPYTKWTKNEDGSMNVTTNYRIILQLGLVNFMKENWVEPGENHYRRLSSKWSCSRATSHQLVRHRQYCFIQASQRYCNYGQDRFGGLTFILPEWIYRVRDRIGNTIDSLTLENRFWILQLDGERLWNELTIWDRTVAGRDRLWSEIEKEYLSELYAGDGEILKPEEARGILPNDTKTELIMTGYKEDWFYEPESSSSEKAGFFFLRCASDAQADIRVLARSLKEQFEQKGYDKWK